METKRNVPNPGFDLSQMKAGDSFLGCPACGFHLSPNSVARRCGCGANFYIYTVTPDDFLVEAEPGT